MTEEEARKALFELHYEYMAHSPKERLKLYDEYQEKRAKIRQALMENILEQKENNVKIK